MPRMSRRSLVLLVCFGALGVTAAPAAAAKPPQAKITKGPLAITTKAEAEFAFKTKRTKNVSCRRDSMPYRPCDRTVKYTGLLAGRHTFKLRARRGKKTVYATRRWTVVPQAGITPPFAPKIEPNPLPAPTPSKLIFSDEFNGTALNTAVWRPHNGPGHKDHGLRRASAVTLDGKGNLVVTATPVNGTTVSGALANRADFLYGRIVFRVKTEADPTGTLSGEIGTWPLRQFAPEWTENNIYSTGQVVDNRSVFSSYVHFGARNWQKLFKQPSDPTKWHTMIMDWTPDRIDITRDGSLVWSITNRLFIPDVLHHVIIQLDARTDRPLKGAVRMLVDYVRVYQ